MVGGGPGNWDPGEWTDDTQMAICIAEKQLPASSNPYARAVRTGGYGPRSPGSAEKGTARKIDAIDVFPC